MLITACILILGIQCFYLCLFLIQFSRTRHDSPDATPEPVSIIVCAHDEEQNLRELIPLLNQQDYPDFEIVIVEDRGNDGALDYLMEAALTYPRLKIVTVKQKPDHVNGKKFALTLGIRAARHERILFTDADCRPATTSWIRNMSNQFSDETQIVLGFSAYEKSDGLLNLFIRFETLIAAIQYVSFAWMKLPYMGVGRNLAYRKSLFLASKGFNNHLNVTGGDDDLFVNEHANATNTRVVIGADALVYSVPKQTVRGYYVQKLRHLSVGKYYRLSSRIMVGGFAVSWLLTWLLVVPGAFFTPYVYWVGGAFLLRWILLIFLSNTASRKLGDPLEGWKTPFLEFIYTFYYLVAGVAALLSKKVRWKI